MRYTSYLRLMGCAAICAATCSFAADTSIVPPLLSCGNGVPGGVYCPPSKSDLKLARNAYDRGLKLQHRHRDEEALAQFDEASRLMPQDMAFLSAWQLTRAQLTFQHQSRAEDFLANGQPEQATAEFKAALKIDPDNAYLQARLAEAERPSNASILDGISLQLANSAEIHIQPKNEQATFHYSGDVRGLFTELATAYGVAVQFDDSVPARNVRFYVDNVDFFTALDLASKVSKTMWTGLAAKQFLIAANTPDNRKQFERMSLATFVVPAANTPQQTTEVITALRNVCDFQKISTGQSGTVEIRAPQTILSACAKLIRELDNERPEVTIDLGIYNISHNFTREIGMHLPNTFNLYNIPVGALAALGGQSIQSLINELISSGGINQAGSSALSGLLAQLEGQPNSIFSQPLATFGGGITFSGLSLDHLTAALSLNESWSRSLSHAMLRSSQGSDATFHLGERYPILNASYAPIYNSPQIAAVIGNQSYTAPIPSISYEDIGLNIKLKPVVHGNGEVSMTLEMQVRSLTGQSSDGIPVISNQEYHGSIRLRDGEPAVVAGEITTNDERTMEGLPIVSEIPGFNLALNDNTVMKEDDELLIMITPHVVANHGFASHEIWVGER